jgi:hypothetical protein
MIICEHCNSKLSNRASLSHHQKNAKYCLAKRGKWVDNYFCHGCDSVYSTKRRLDTHMSICFDSLILKNNYDHIQKLEDKDKQIEHLKKQVRILQDKLENVAIKAVSRPITTKTQINNYIRNMLPVTENHMLEQSKKLTIEHIQRGPEGYAEYALEHSLKDRVVCVDYSRRKIKFKDSYGLVIIDPEMTTLATKFFNSIKDQNMALIQEYGERLREDFSEDNVDRLIEIGSYRSDVNKGSEGQKSDFQYDFVKNICSHTVKEV